MPNLPAIGDSRSKLHRIRQAFDLPLDRDSIIKRFQSILELGGVQKVVIELGHPIKVERLIRPGDEAPQELPEESDFGLAMNSEVIEHLMEEIKTHSPISSLRFSLSLAGRVGRRPF